MSETDFTIEKLQSQRDLLKKLLGLLKKDYAEMATNIKETKLALGRTERRLGGN